MKRLSKQDIAEIKELVLKMTYEDVAKIVGCAPATVGRYVEKFGLRNKRYHGHYKHLGEIAKENWAKHSVTEVAQIIGCAPSTVFSYVASHGITRTDEEKREIRKRSVQKITEKNRMLAQSDKRRITFGLEPKTKWFTNLAPKRVLAATYRLHHKHGYEYTDDPYTMSRNGHIIRSKKKSYDEEYYTRTFGLKFID